MKIRYKIHSFALFVAVFSVMSLPCQAQEAISESNALTKARDFILEMTEGYDELDATDFNYNTGVNMTDDGIAVDINRENFVGFGVEMNKDFLTNDFRFTQDNRDMEDSEMSFSIRTGFRF